jgi:hypothetical protein
MFGSFGAGFSSLGAGVGGLLPSFTNITSWLRSPTTDGKTLANNKGTDANLTGVNCLNLDGTDDEVNTGYNPQGGNLIIEATIKPDSVTSQRTIFGVNGNSGFWLRIENGQWDLYSRNAFIFQNSTVITPTVGNIYDIRVEYDYSTEDWIAKVKLSTDSTYTTIGTGNRLPPIVGSANVILGQKGTSGYFDGEFYSFKLTEGGNVKVDYPFAEGSGVKTFDVSGSGNHGLITGATWTTEDGIESWNHEYGFDTDIFKGYAGYWNLPSSGSGTWTRNESNLTLTGNTGTSGRIRQVVDGMVSGDTLVVSGTITQTTAQGGGVDIAISSASAGWVEGTVFLGGQLGTYTFSKTFNANSSTCDIQFVALGGANAIISDLKFTVVKKIPALNTKTKQVATFDGQVNEVNFGTHAIPASDSIEVVFTPQDEADSGIVYSMGRPSGGSGFGIKWDGTNDRISFRTADVPRNNILNLVTSTNSCVADGTTYKVTYDYDSSAGTATLVLFNADTGATIETKSATGVATATFDVGSSRPLKIGADQFDLDYYSGTIHSVKSSFIDVDFQANIGTTTVIDNSGNGNNGTVAIGSGGTATFWGTRVADTAGSLVSADYATGNLTISNLGGFVHNGSECGFETGLQELTSTEIFAINNSTATQLFIRKNNGNITQFLEYEDPLTGTDLTRTRAYVG